MIKYLVAHYVNCDVNLFAMHVNKTELSHQGRMETKICKKSYFTVLIILSDWTIKKFVSCYFE
jgi:hypothetical protein